MLAYAPGLGSSAHASGSRCLGEHDGRIEAVVDVRVLGQQQRDYIEVPAIKRFRASDTRATEMTSETRADRSGGRI
jgi:hypothetical protein